VTAVVEQICKVNGQNFFASQDDDIMAMTIATKTDIVLWCKDFFYVKTFRWKHLREYCSVNVAFQSFCAPKNS